MAETGDGPRQRAARPPEVADPAGRYALTVAADEIRPGDWLRDQGELRQVERIEPVHERLPARSSGAGAPGPTAFIVRFEVPPHEPPSHLFIPAEVLVSVWRPNPEPE
jgi:hypothetical protein